MKVILNPKYHIYVDNCNVHLMTKDLFRSSINNEEQINFKIHPVVGYILNSFDGSEYDSIITDISNYLEIDMLSIKKFTDNLIYNSDIFEFTFDNVTYYFPKECLITDSDKKRDIISYESFEFETDSANKRAEFPYDITLMVSTKCGTDCIYCYADRRELINCEIPKNRIIELIDEARLHHARSFDIIGGEFLMFKDWKEICNHLIKNDFKPYLSTKIPLSKKNIDDIIDIGLSDIQISLDTLLERNACHILNVKENYTSKMIKTINSLEERGVIVYIHTIINSSNDSVEDMDSLYKYLKSRKNIGQWKIDLAAPSLYKKDYNKFKPKKENIYELQEYFKKINTDWIVFGGLYIEDLESIPKETKAKSFKDRPACSANLSKLFILPDGNVTICEELYWNERYIIGNILNKSIENIWNSKRAKNLVNIPQNEIPIDSPCSRCIEYKNCKLSYKQVCYREILKAYGEDKWYFPDPKCPKAPAFKYQLNP